MLIKSSASIAFNFESRFQRQLPSISNKDFSVNCLQCQIKIWASIVLGPINRDLLRGWKWATSASASPPSYSLLQHFYTFHFLQNALQRFFCWTVFKLWKRMLLFTHGCAFNSLQCVESSNSKRDKIFSQLKYHISTGSMMTPLMSCGTIILSENWSVSLWDGPRISPAL